MSDPHASSLVRRLGELVNGLKKAGLEADEVALILQARAKSRGLQITIGVQKIGAVSMLDMSLSPEQAQVLLGDAVTAQPAEQCAGPHLACPSCGHPDALCLRPDILKLAGVRREDLPGTGACPHCGAFLVMIRESEPWHFRLMSEQEVLGLSDQDRMGLQRARRRALERREQLAEAMRS